MKKQKFAVKKKRKKKGFLQTIKKDNCKLCNQESKDKKKTPNNWNNHKSTQASDINQSSIWKI